MYRRQFILALAALAAGPSLASTQAPNTPEGLVRALYAAQTQAVQRGQRVLNSPTLRRRFLTPALAAAIERSREASGRDGGLVGGGLAFDPITASQEDTELGDLQVRELSADRDQAIVFVSFMLWEQRVELNYILARIDGAWRVYDIRRLESERGSGWSVRRILRMDG